MKSLYWKLAFLWAIVIFALSSIPGKSLPEMPALHYDKVVHALVYAVLGGFCCLALPPTVPRRLAVPGAALMATMYGMTDEFHQLFVAGRSADLYDVLADACGGLVGAGTAALLAGFRGFGG
jgi:VanZ family protein